MHPVARPACQRLREAPARRVGANDVVLEVDPAAGAGDDVEHRPVGVRSVDQEPDLVARDRPAAGRAVDRVGDRLLGADRDGGGAGAGHAAPSPRMRSWGRSAPRTNAMWSSSGTPSSAAPCSTSSRLTPRAKALSLSFFLTDSGSRPQLVDREERPRHGRIARHAGVVRVPQDGAPARLRQAESREDADALRRMLLGGRVRRVGVALVVEVVQQPHQPPCLDVLPRPLRHRAHGELDRVHVLSQRVGGGVLVHQGEGVGAGEGHGGGKVTVSGER